MSPRPVVAWATPGDGSLLPAIERTAAVAPDRVALTLEGDSLTYGALAARSHECAGGLMHVLGVEKGDRVALLARNRLEYFEVEIGVSCAGAVLVALSWRYAVAEVLALLAASQAVTAFADADFVEPIDQARRAGKLPHLRHVVTFGESLGAADLRYEELRTRGRSAQTAASPEPTRAGTLADPHEIIYTSGTTGLPKGAVWTFGGVMFNAIQQIADYGITGDSATFVSFDLNYIGGRHQYVWAILLQGGRVHLKRSGGFSAAVVADAVERHRVTHLLLVPTMLSDVLDHLEHDRPDWSSLSMLMCGGAPVTRELLDRATALLPSVWVSHVYGLTEAGGTVTHNPRDARLDRRASAGIPSFNVELRIVDAGRRCAAGEVGEIQVKAPTTCGGYWDDPEATRQLFDGPWVRTGDLGYLDTGGYLHVTGRLKELIISGGMNIFPAEVEEVLERHPDVLRAAVFAVPDQTWGEAVAAAIEMRSGAVTTESELIAHCRDSLAGHKRPRHVYVVDELPKTASGKIKKSDLPALVGAGAQQHG